MKKKVVILDFEAGNILSLTRAIESLDYNYELTKNKSKIRDVSLLFYEWCFWTCNKNIEYA